jgi:hypothetical protein
VCVCVCVFCLMMSQNPWVIDQIRNKMQVKKESSYKPKSCWFEINSQGVKWYVKVEL